MGEGEVEVDADWRARLRTLTADFARRPTPRDSAERARAAVAWQSELADAGLAAPGWPAEVGGMALTLPDQIDYHRMLGGVRAPRHPCPVAFIVAPTLIVHGTEQQKERYLEPILRATEFWCQGFSEPGAGSDLASLTTRAQRDGHVYRVSGRKIWTTGADRADWMFALVRTGPPGRGSEGITCLLIPMSSQGIEVTPLRDAAGGRHFSEVLLDGVEVPVANRVGQEGAGWEVVRTSLGHERATAFLADEFRYRATVDEVFSVARSAGLGSDPVVRQDLARIETTARVIAANGARALDTLLDGGDPGPVASVNRLVKSEFDQLLHRVALELTGPAAVLGGRAQAAVHGGKWTYGYLMSRAATIGAGTAEMQRNTIAESVLGLPSHKGDGRRDPVVPPGDPLAPSHPEERDLRRALSAIAENVVTTASILEREHGEGGLDVDVWSALVDFGLPGLAAPAGVEGGGQPLSVLCVAVEQTAHHLAPAPLVPTAAALTLLVDAGADDAARLVARGAPAAVAADVGSDGWVVGRGTGDGPVVEGGRVSGRVGVVEGSPEAEWLVVPATDADGSPLLAMVRGTDAGCTPQQPLDLTGSVGEVWFDGAAADIVATGDTVLRALRRSRVVADLLVAADSVGVAARALRMAVDWAGTREQFGRPIGSFQAVSHRCADLLVAVESARALVGAAADCLDAAGVPSGPVLGGDPDSLAPLATAAALTTAVEAAEACIQIHGGIGFTWEHPAHLLLRRARANVARVGRPDRIRGRAVDEVFAAMDRGRGVA